MMKVVHTISLICLVNAVLLASISSVFLFNPGVLSWLNQDGLSYTKNFWGASALISLFAAIVAGVVYRISSTR